MLTGIFFLHFSCKFAGFVVYWYYREVCTYAGVWLEEKFDFPWTVIMIVVGVLAGVRNVIAMVKRMKQITEEDADEEE